MKAFKAFRKPFDEPQRSTKIKIDVNFLSSSGIWTEKVNVLEEKLFQSSWIHELKFL